MSGAIRTGSHAVSAAYTPVIINHHNTVAFFPRSLSGTNLYTWGVFTLLALNRHVKAPLFGNFMRIIVFIRLFKDVNPLLTFF